MINFKRIAPASYSIRSLGTSPIIGYFLTYCLGAILIRGISFFTLPLIMHTIAPSDYGIFSLLAAFTIITTAIIGLGLRQFLSIEYFHADMHKRHRLIHDIIIMYTGIAFPIIIALWHLRSFIMSIIFFNAITSYQFLGVLITTFLFFYSELMYQLLQYEQAAKLLILIQCSVALFIAGSTIWSVLYVRIGITGMIWSQTIGACIAATLACTYLYKYRHTVHTHYMPARYYLRYGFPFIPGILANWILSSSDRWLLGYYTTMHDVGIYAVADLASQLFYVVILQSWASSYLPYIMKRYQEHPHALTTIEEENHHTMWTAMITLAIIISLGYPMGYFVAQKLLPITYLVSLRYVWILLMGQIFLLGSYFATAFIQYTKHIYFLAFTLFIPASCNIILNFIFIPHWGIMGSSIATLVSYALYFIITYSYNRKLLFSLKETL